MRSSTKRILVILASFGLLVGSMYTYLSLIVPTYLDIQKLRAERLYEQDILASQKRAEQAVDKLLGEYESLGKIQEALSILLPRDIDVTSIVNQLQGMARNSQMTLQSVSFQYLPIKESADPFIQPIGVVRATMNLFGTYQGIKSYIQALESNVRIMDLDSLKIDGGARPNREIFNYSLIVDIYYQQ